MIFCVNGPASLGGERCGLVTTRPEPGTWWNIYGFWSSYIYIECSFCRLIRHLGSFLESLIGRQCGSPPQTEGHSFADHLISAVLHHQVLQKLPAIVLCSVSLWLM
jgi:hypothetical protein